MRIPLIFTALIFVLLAIPIQNAQADQMYLAADSPPEFSYAYADLVPDLDTPTVDRTVYEFTLISAVNDEGVIRLSIYSIKAKRWWLSDAHLRTLLKPAIVPIQLE